MKKLLPPLALVLACAMFFLRRMQLAAYDANGLLPDGSPVSIALYLGCTLAAALVLIVCLRDKASGFGVPAGKDRLRGVLVIVSALALLGSYLPPEFQGGVRNIVPVLAFAAACAMAVEGVYHMSGSTGTLLGGCILPVYLATLLISDYRAWSYDPLVYHFAFRLLFIVAAMLAVPQRHGQAPHDRVLHLLCPVLCRGRAGRRRPAPLPAHLRPVPVPDRRGLALSGSAHAGAGGKRTCRGGQRRGRRE